MKVALTDDKFSCEPSYNLGVYHFCMRDCALLVPSYNTLSRGAPPPLGAQPHSPPPHPLSLSLTLNHQVTNVNIALADDKFSCEPSFNTAALTLPSSL